MKKLSMVFILLAVSALFLTACSEAPAPAAAATLESIQPEGVIAEGRLSPANVMDQAFSAPGQVAEVLVKDGDVVEAGQVLARLNSPAELQLALTRAEQEILAAEQGIEDLRAAAETNAAQAKLAVLAAQDELDTAQNRYDSNKTDANEAALAGAVADLNAAEEQLKKLKAGSGVDPDLMEAAEARLASAEASAASSRAAFDTLELRSTISGTVIDLDLQAGEHVAAGQAVLTVADVTSWVIKTDNLTETEVVGVKVGQQVKITLDALPDQPLDGEVTHINARFEEKRGDVTYTVTAVLKNSDPLMRWGMTAAVQFIP